MQKKVHMAFGVFCGLVALYFLRVPFGVWSISSITNASLFLAAAFVASTIPDYDLLIPGMRHRGISHSLLALMVVTIISTIAGLYFKHDTLFWFCAGFPIGYLSHLISDSFTDHRVAWLQPFDNTPYGYPIFNTGSALIQGILMILLWCANGALIYLILGG